MRIKPFGGPILGVAALALVLSGCGGRVSTSPPDAGGRRLLVFASDRNRAPGQFELYLYDLDLGGFRLIEASNSPTAADLHPTMTPDVRAIAFQSDRGGANGTDILLYDRGLGSLVDLPTVNTTAEETNPAFTNDGLKLAFTRTVSGFRRIKLVNGVTDSLVALPGLDTTASFNDWDPAPNRDGTRIAFVSDRNGNPDVFVYEAATRQLLNIPELRSDSIDTEPWLTPDGRYLAFASNRADTTGGFNVHLWDITGGTFLSLGALNTDMTERNPALSADANLVIFESDRTGSFGKLDLWNYSRGSGAIGRAVGESSSADDIDPFLIWP